MQRLFITALACLISVSVFGQVNEIKYDFLNDCRYNEELFIKSVLKIKYVQEVGIVGIHKRLDYRSAAFHLLENGIAFNVSQDNPFPHDTLNWFIEGEHLFVKYPIHKVDLSENRYFNEYYSFSFNLEIFTSKYYPEPYAGINCDEPGFKRISGVWWVRPPKNPDLNYCINNAVNQKMNEWQVKGEFEKQTDYLNRVSPTERNKKLKSFLEETINHYTHLATDEFYHQLSDANFVNLGLYDSENESFRIEFMNYGSIVLNIPIDDAPGFKKDFNPENFQKVDVFLSNNEFKISEIHYSNYANEIELEYLSSDTIKYDIYEDYKFDEINLQSNEESISSSIHNSKPSSSKNKKSLWNRLFKTKEITFQSSDSIFYINSIAVIPKTITSCDGTMEVADELASFTETNILSHYNVTDRRHLEAILEEHRLQMSGLTFEKTLLESGCIENAQAYLFVREGCLKGDETIELRLVHCETSTLVWSCTGINASPQEVLERINQELSKD